MAAPVSRRIDLDALTLEQLRALDRALRAAIAGGGAAGGGRASVFLDEDGACAVFSFLFRNPDEE
jgi:hypothetical protein